LIVLINTDYEGTIDVGNPGEFTIFELAKMVKLNVNPNVKIMFRQTAADHPKQRKLDIRKAKATLKWEPRIPL
jgi:UDP-glucuronate decarboxylase